MKCSARYVALAFLAFAAVLGAAKAWGQTNWQGGSGPWTSGVEWDNGVPTAGVDAVINNGGIATINQSGAACDYLILGSQVGKEGTVQEMAGGQLFTVTENVGSFGKGSFTQSGGTNSASAYLTVGGYSNGSGGSYGMGGGLLSTDEVQVLSPGSANAGVFLQTSGTVEAGGGNLIGLLLDSSPGTVVASYDLQGGLLASTGTESIGFLGGGSFTQTGGTHSVSSEMFVGDLGSGTYSL